ncbi:MAG: aminoglycoside 6-adenylyltransferase [Anaerolineaceae bacterium]|nr:aminoglycoside 6-adenylyltransferase [Anaerolineaceae bacterium]
MIARFAPPDETTFLTLITRWAETQPAVRAMILTSTRAVPNATCDLLSDYDIILILTDIIPYHQSRDWLAAFGQVLALYRDPIESKAGYPQSGYVIQFEGSLKIDFSLWRVEYFQHLMEQTELMDELDAGYRVLLDKDGLTDQLKPPTYQAYIPHPPTERVYLETLENFFLDTTYVAKYLWRDDLVAAKHILDDCIKQEYLVPMLEWHIELNHNWAIKPGPYGRGLKKWLRSDLWADLESTYAGCGLAENWIALENTIQLMRKVAIEVGKQLGFNYPEGLERRVRAYVDQIHQLDTTHSSV